MEKAAPSIGGNAENHPKRRTERLRPGRTGDPSNVTKWGQRDKSQRREEMRHREHRVRRKGGIECGQLRAGRDEVDV